MVTVCGRRAMSGSRRFGVCGAAIMGDIGRMIRKAGDGADDALPQPCEKPVELFVAPGAIPHALFVNMALYLPAQLLTQTIRASATIDTDLGNS